MPKRQSRPATEFTVDADEILQEITRIAYLITRNRRHDRVRSVADVPLDRAAVMVLGQLAKVGPVRTSELATTLEVEAPHVTRQVQRLEGAGYVDRAPDPNDGRAQIIRLTPSGKAAAERIRQAGTSAMQAALAHWPTQELHELATLLHRMVDDFLAFTAQEENDQPAHHRVERERDIPAVDRRPTRRD
jgi:DNA-binding MarR family transcriptional regulator